MSGAASCSDACSCRPCLPMIVCRSTPGFSGSWSFPRPTIFGRIATAFCGWLPAARLDRPDGVYRPQSCQTRGCSGLVGVAGPIVWRERTWGHWKAHHAEDPSRWPLATPSFNSASRAQGAMKLDLGSQRSVRPVPSSDYRDFYCCDTPTFMAPSGTLLLAREH